MAKSIIPVKNPKSKWVQIDPNLDNGRLRMAVVWREARRHVGEDDLLQLRFGEEERHHRFLFHHTIAPLVRRRPPPRARIATPTCCDEPSLLVAPLVGRVVLLYCSRRNNGGRWRGGGHDPAMSGPLHPRWSRGA